MTREEWIVVALVLAILGTIAVWCSVRKTDDCQGMMAAACKNNLFLIQTAKLAWANEIGVTGNVFVAVADIEAYFENGMPMCSATKTNAYQIGRLEELPACAIHGRNIATK